MGVASIRRASSIASSAQSWEKALVVGCHASARRRALSTSSTLVTSPAWSPGAISPAVSSSSSRSAPMARTLVLDELADPGHDLRDGLIHLRAVLEQHQLGVRHDLGEDPADLVRVDLV